MWSLPATSTTTHMLRCVHTHSITHWDLSIAKSTVIILLSKYHLSFVFLPSRWRRIQTHLKPPLPPPQGPHTRQSPSYKVTAVWMAGRGRGNVKRWVPAAVSYEFNVCVYHEGTGEIKETVWLWRQVSAKVFVCLWIGFVNTMESQPYMRSIVCLTKDRHRHDREIKDAAE